MEGDESFFRGAFGVINKVAAPVANKPKIVAQEVTKSGEDNEERTVSTIAFDIALYGIGVVVIGWVLINWALSAISFGLAIGFVVLVVIMVTAVYNAIRKR